MADENANNTEAVPEDTLELEQLDGVSGGAVELANAEALEE
jgi:hypothetical protein